MTVYVLHFSEPYQHARHYVGYTPDATSARRVGEHLACNGKASPLVKAAIHSGIAVTLAHEFPGASRTFERWIKNRKSVSDWCPLCARGRRRVPLCTLE
jgi:hypothetical protein